MFLASTLFFGDGLAAFDHGSHDNIMASNGVVGVGIGLRRRIGFCLSYLGVKHGETRVCGDTVGVQGHKRRYSHTEAGFPRRRRELGRRLFRSRHPHAHTNNLHGDSSWFTAAWDKKRKARQWVSIYARRENRAPLPPEHGSTQTQLGRAGKTSGVAEDYTGFFSTTHKTGSHYWFIIRELHLCWISFRHWEGVGFFDGSLFISSGSMVSFSPQLSRGLETIWYSHGMDWERGGGSVSSSWVIPRGLWLSLAWGISCWQRLLFLHCRERLRRHFSSPWRWCIAFGEIHNQCGSFVLFCLSCLGC